MKFSRQQSGSRLSFPTPGDLLDTGNEPTSPVLAGHFFTTVPPGKLISCVVVVHSLGCVLLIVTAGMAACWASLSFPISWSSLKLMSIESVMQSNHLILSRPFLLLPSVFPSTRVFSNKSALHIRWPKYYSFSFSTSPSDDYSELIFIRTGLCDLLAVQGTLKSLLLYHSSKTSILQPPTFFMVQLSHPYVTTGKAIALTT